MFTPKGPMWQSVTSPLSNGIAISRALRVGTLGAAIARQNEGDVVITCASHVLSGGGPCQLWMNAGGSGAWQVTGVIDSVTPPASQRALFTTLDLVFLSLSNVTAINDVFGNTPAPAVRPPAPGTYARYCGASHGWWQCVYEGPYSPAYAGTFGSLSAAGLLDLSAMGVVGFDATGYDADAYEGDSGAVVSTKLLDGTESFFGSLVGVSAAQPKGLILLLDVAFQCVGLTSYKVLGAP
jgi:hypothetical protein